MNILVVDDDREIVDSISIFLEGEGYRVLKAYNGLEALDALTEQEVHLMILDIMMPGLDGFAVLMEKVGRAFGHFQMQLADFDASVLYESIPNFHNTVSRFADFEKALSDDLAGRAAGIKDDIQFILDRKDKCSFIMDGIADGRFPLRVTHNDTKIKAEREGHETESNKTCDSSSGGAKYGAHGFLDGFDHGVVCGCTFG